MGASAVTVLAGASLWALVQSATIIEENAAIAFSQSWRMQDYRSFRSFSAERFFDRWLIANIPFVLFAVLCDIL
jgi:hypothetical protein